VAIMKTWFQRTPTLYCLECCSTYSMFRCLGSHKSYLGCAAYAALFSFSVVVVV